MSTSPHPRTTRGGRDALALRGKALRPDPGDQFGDVAQGIAAGNGPRASTAGMSDMIESAIEFVWAWPRRSERPARRCRLRSTGSLCRPFPRRRRSRGEAGPRPSHVGAIRCPDPWQGGPACGRTSCARPRLGRGERRKRPTETSSGKRMRRRERDDHAVRSAGPASDSVRCKISEADAGQASGAWVPGQATDSKTITGRGRSLGRIEH